MRVVRCGSPDDWARRVANDFIALLEARPHARLCLATGTTPEPVYTLVANAVGAGLLSFRRAEVFLLDEFGGVPASSKGRCDQMLRRALLDHVDLPRARYHGLEPEAGAVDAMCQAYDVAIGGSLDLALLGLGRNGHIGMNEPGSPPDATTRRVALEPDTTAAARRYFEADEALPTWGVTLGFGPLLASRTIWLLATGDHKASIVRDVVVEPISLQRPASLLRKHPDCSLFLDDAAAARLPAHAGTGF